MAEDMAQTVISLYGDGVEQRYPTTNGLPATNGLVQRNPR